MSGSLARPDWAADIKNLDRRLGILERRTTPKTTGAAVDPLAVMLATTVAVDQYDPGGAYFTPSATIVALFERIHLVGEGASANADLAAGESQVGPVRLPYAYAFFVSAANKNFDGPFLFSATLHGANADMSAVVWAHIANATIDGPAGSFSLPVAGDWTVGTFGTDLEFTDGGAIRAVAEGIYWFGFTFNAYRGPLAI